MKVGYKEKGGKCQSNRLPTVGRSNPPEGMFRMRRTFEQKSWWGKLEEGGDEEAGDARESID